MESKNLFQINSYTFDLNRLVHGMANGKLFFAIATIYIQKYLEIVDWLCKVRQKSLSQNDVNNDDYGFLWISLKIILTREMK